MTLEDKRSEGDILQIEHENSANAHRVLLVGKTTSGDYIEVLINDEGKVMIG